MSEPMFSNPIGYTDPVRAAKFPTGVNKIMTWFVLQIKSFKSVESIRGHTTSVIFLSDLKALDPSTISAPSPPRKLSCQAHHPIVPARVSAPLMAQTWPRPPLRRWGIPPTREGSPGALVVPWACPVRGETPAAQTKAEWQRSRAAPCRRTACRVRTRSRGGWGEASLATRDRPLGEDQDGPERPEPVCVRVPQAPQRRRKQRHIETIGMVYDKDGYTSIRIGTS